MNHVGILAYGSLQDNPGREIEMATCRVIDNIRTPFRVEFARKSRRRGGAPTLVPVTEGGGVVKARILVLRGEVSEHEAMDMLWRRETDKVDTKRRYTARPKIGRDAVVIRRI